MTEVVRLEKPPARRFAVYIIMLLSWAQIYMGMQTVATYGADIMADLGVSNSTLALISNGFTLALGIMCVVSGIIAVRLGGKKTILLGCAVQIVAGLLFFTGPTDVGVLVVIRIIEGIGAGLINAYALSLIAAWFPRKERSFATGLQMGLYGVAVSATALFCNAFNAMGLTWAQGCGAFVTGAGVICGLLVALFYTDIEKLYGVHVIDDALEPAGDEPDAGEPQGSGSVHGFKRPASYGELFRSPVFWLLAVPICSATAVSYNLPFCFPLLFPESGYTATQTAAVLSVAFMGTIVTSPLGGLISDKVFHGRRGQTMAIAFALGLVTVLAFSFAISAHIGFAGITVLAVGAYASVFVCQGPMWALPPEIFESGFFVRANGVLLLFCNLAGLLNITASGMLADITGSYMPGVYVSVVLIAASFVCSVILSRRYGA